jgi:hypothetical protein
LTNEKARDSGVKPRSAAQTPAKSAASDASQLASFMRISLVLTGAKTLDADLAEAYFQSARGNLSAKLDALLTHFDDLVTNGRDPGAAVREAILPDNEDGPSAKLILLLWYTGGIQTPGRDWDVQSADRYYRALVWEAVGAHPPTLSNGYFGHWKYPPES